MMEELNIKNSEMDIKKDFSGEEQTEMVKADTVSEDIEKELGGSEGCREEESVNDDSVDEDEIEEEETEDEDLYTAKKEKIVPKLKEGDYLAMLTDVIAERRLSGKFGKPWVNIGLKFKIKNPDTGEYVEISFNANKSLSTKSRLYPIVKGLLGEEPGDDLNLKELKGKKAWVSIKHTTDTEGNIWANIVTVRKYTAQ